MRFRINTRHTSPSAVTTGSTFVEIAVPQSVAPMMAATIVACSAISLIPCPTVQVRVDKILMRYTPHTAPYAQELSPLRPTKGICQP